MKICSNCGASIGDNEKFCSNCGSKQTEADQPGTQQEYTQSEAQQMDSAQADTQQTYSQSEEYQTNYNNYQPQPAGTSGFAIAGFVLSIVAIFLNGFFFIPSILGIIFSCIGLSQCKKGKGGKGLAIAGLVISIVFLVIYLALIAVSVTAVSYYVADEDNLSTVFNWINTFQ